MRWQVAKLPSLRVWTLRTNSHDLSNHFCGNVILTKSQRLVFFGDHLPQVVIAYSRSWNVGYNQFSLVLCWSPWRQCMAGAVGWWRKDSATNDGNCERSVLEPEVWHHFASKCGYEVTDGVSKVRMHYFCHTDWCIYNIYVRSLAAWKGTLQKMMVFPLMGFWAMLCMSLRYPDGSLCSWLFEHSWPPDI